MSESELSPDSRADEGGLPGVTTASLPLVLGAMFDHLPSAVGCIRVVIPTDEPGYGVYAYANKAFNKQTGVENAVGMRVSEVRPERGEADADISRRLARIAFGATPESFQYRVPASGEWYALSAFSPLAGHVVVVIDEITEAKRVEAELAELRAEFDARLGERALALVKEAEGSRDLFERLPVGVVVQAANGAIVTANDAACQILRLTEDQIHGRTSVDPGWQSVREDGSPFPGEEHPAMRTLADGKPLRGVVMGLGVPEDRHWISINSDALVRPGEKMPYAVTTSFIDITARVRDGAFLQELRKRYEGVLAAATEVAMIATDREGLITLFNTGAELMLGYTEEEVLGKAPTIFVDPEDVAHTDTDVSLKLGVQVEGTVAVQAAVDEFGSFRRNVSYVRRDGTRVRVAMTATPMVTDAGETTGYLRVVQDISERAELEEMLRRQARTDGLTGLANRMAMNEAAGAEFLRVRRFKTPCSLVLVDVDQFRSVNEGFGHEGGDRVLSAVGRTMRAMARATDLAARYGGDEFVMLLVGTDLAGAMVVAEHVRAELEALVVKQEQKSTGFTVSIGVAEIEAGDESWQGTLRRADRGLFRAKAIGRNQVVGLGADERVIVGGGNGRQG